MQVTVGRDRTRILVPRVRYDDQCDFCIRLLGWGGFSWPEGVDVGPLYHGREICGIGRVESPSNRGPPDNHAEAYSRRSVNRSSSNSAFSSSSIFVSKSSIEYFMGSSAFRSPEWVRVALARSQKIAAKAFLPLLFPGITRSTSSVTLSVSHIAITGTPSFPASTMA